MKPISGDSCRYCFGPFISEDGVSRAIVREAEDARFDDVVYEYYVHPSCDASASPATLNEVREEILGE